METETIPNAVCARCELRLEPLRPLSGTPGAHTLVEGQNRKLDMTKILISLAEKMGFPLVPENHKAAIMRFGMYNRARGPGFVWVAPFIESVEDLVKIGVRLATFTSRQVFSSDGIPFDFELAIRYRFDPDSTSRRSIAAQLIRQPDHVLDNIVRDYADQSLRRTVAGFSAEDICYGGRTDEIAQQMVEDLRARVDFLGLTLEVDGSVPIKKIAESRESRIREKGILILSPEDVKRLEVMVLDLLHSFIGVEKTASEEVRHLRRLIEQHEKNKRRLELMIAKHSSLYTPLHLMNALDDEEQKLREIELRLENLFDRPINREDP
jgi:hypothetical protein